MQKLRASHVSCDGDFREPSDCYPTYKPRDLNNLLESNLFGTSPVQDTAGSPCQLGAGLLGLWHLNGAPPENRWPHSPKRRQRHRNRQTDRTVQVLVCPGATARARSLPQPLHSALTFS